jgi:hypothetical protein
MTFAWVFTELRSRTTKPVVFLDLTSAMAWIRDNYASGSLYEYPVDISLTDWVIQEFGDKEEIRHGRLEEVALVYIKHWHFRNGAIVAASIELPNGD